jgi:hypothetical protein
MGCRGRRTLQLKLAGFNREIMELLGVTHTNVNHT